LQNGEDALLWDLLGDVEAGFFVEAGAYDGYTFSVSYLFECAGWDGLLIEPLADKAAACAARRTGSRVVAAALAGPDSPSRMSLLRDEVEWNSRLSGDGDGELVDVTTLDTLLEGHEGAIDFAVLDLEGHELEALRGFDLARWQPTAILVEDNTGKDAALREHLEANGYVHIASLVPNELFLRREERHRAERLAPYWGDLGLS